MVRLKGVTKVYERPEGGVVALRDVTLLVTAGEFLALVGPSGCGKSTLLNLVGGLDRPSSGEVFVKGLPLASLSEGELTRLRREEIGIVYQFFNLLPTLTAAENVALPLVLNGRSLREALPLAEEALARVGLEGRGRHRPYELSGGEMQRVALARAIVHRPRLLLADEPTGNLDSTAGDLLLSHLQTLSAKEGLTLLLATHSREAAAFASRIAPMKDGRLSESPAPSDRGA
jgi:ABC-type lipoprotein export system ATPase subunit